MIQPAKKQAIRFLFLSRPLFPHYSTRKFTNYSEIHYFCIQF